MTTQEITALEKRLKELEERVDKIARTSASTRHLARKPPCWFCSRTAEGTLYKIDPQCPEHGHLLEGS